MTVLDISNNVALEHLYCYVNEIDNLDVSQNIALTHLSCGYNKISNLDVTQNRDLIRLECSGNKLVHLDLSNNAKLEKLDLNVMATLSEVCVWADHFPPENLQPTITGSPNVYFTTECLYDSIVYIPDTSFLYALIEEGVDSDRDSLISFGEAEVVTYLDLSRRSETESCTGSISDLTGIEAFAHLDSLDCSCNQLTSMDVSKNEALQCLICAENQLSSLDVSNLVELSRLNVSYNYLTSLDVSNNPELTSLHVWGNNLSNLDISKNDQLESLFIGENPDLTEVCVWNIPFPSPGLTIFREGSPNICFDTLCDGKCDHTDIEAFGNDGVLMYPNPTHTVLTIETVFTDLYEVKITDLNGQIVFNTNFEGTTRQIDLSPFSKGVYFITIRSEDFLTTRKVVKLR
jgi:Leucine-rich repeat (LRR) protein